MNKVKADTVEKNRFHHNAVFADFVNALLYDGRDVILPEHLHEYDSNESSVIGELGIDRTRDIIKMYDVMK